MANHATTIISALLLIHLLPCAIASPEASHATTTSTPYLSSSILFTNYKTMLKTFKIFIYPSLPLPSNYTITQSPTTDLISLFHTTLLSSPFLTEHPNDAHLFFIPFPTDYSFNTRSLSRLISRIRSSYPFWDRTLGADHFFITPQGITPSSSRNVVELKKNAIQISYFPSPIALFIPHKDISIPPLNFPVENEKSTDSVKKNYLGYLRWNRSKIQMVTTGSSVFIHLIDQLKKDPNFAIESVLSNYGNDHQTPEQEGDQLTGYNEEILQRSKFCLFIYETGQVMAGLGEAMLQGCVPVFITSNRPIQDLPFMDILKWNYLALFVDARVGVDGIKSFLTEQGLEKEEKYEKMRRLCVIASKHFMWDDFNINQGGSNSKPFDAFYTLMYQLWNRRHAIRYARSDVE